MMKKLKSLFKPNWAFQENKIYIIPTRLSFYYSILCLLLLAMSYFYENNLLYFLTFYLVSIGLILMWTSNQFLKSIRIQEFNCPDLWMGQIQDKKISDLLDPFIITSSPNQFIKKQVFIKNEKFHVGKNSTPVVILSTVLPLGFFKTWTYRRDKSFFWIYPSPLNWLGNNAFDITSEMKSSQFKNEFNLKPSLDEFVDYRPWEPRDSETKIDFKILAKTQQYMTSVRSSDEHDHIIDWDQTSFLKDVEKRQQQMAFWIQDVMKQTSSYMIKIQNRVYSDSTQALRALSEIKINEH